MQPKGSLNVVLAGRGPLVLRPSDYVATGGEGSIYRATNTIVKLYTDTQKMRRDDMAGKIKLLSAIRHDYVVAPQGLVTNSSGAPIGFFMPYVSGEPLPRIFTNDFRQRVKFDDDSAKTLVDRMRETVRFAHDKGAILVDANEMNWLTILKGKNGPEPRVIDVDSWAIGNWKASVIMPSIRDWRNKEFSPLTDWFSWGVVTFQIFTGIHPYKGTLNGYKPGELERRMKDNASVFAQGIRLNRAVRDFSCIPGPLLDWYHAAFQKGQRSMPPSPFDSGTAIAAAAKIMRTVVTASGALVFDKLFGETTDPAIRIWPCGVCGLKSGRLVDLASKRFIGSIESHDGEVVEVQNGWLVADWINGKLQCSFINNASLQTEVLNLNVKTNKLVRYQNRLFVVTDRGLTELVFRDLGRPIVSLGQTWGVMVNATRWFDGVGVEDAMGATFLVIPFGGASCVQVRVRELDGLRSIDAKAGERFVSIVAVDRNGDYKKIELTFDSSYQTYQAQQESTDNLNLNLAILPKGVCAMVTTDGALDIFVPTSGKVNHVQDKHINTGMILSNWDNKVVYIENGAVWSVRMK